MGLLLAGLVKRIEIGARWFAEGREEGRLRRGLRGGGRKGGKGGAEKSGGADEKRGTVHVIPDVMLDDAARGGGDSLRGRVGVAHACAAQAPLYWLYIGAVAKGPGGGVRSGTGYGGGRIPTSSRTPGDSGEGACVRGTGTTKLRG